MQALEDSNIWCDEATVRENMQKPRSPVEERGESYSVFSLIPSSSSWRSSTSAGQPVIGSLAF